MHHTMNPAARRFRRLGPSRRLSMLTVMALLAGCLTSVVVAALTGIPAARADTVPPPPPGGTSGCTAPPAPPSTATRYRNSRCTPADRRLRDDEDREMIVPLQGLRN